MCDSRIISIISIALGRSSKRDRLRTIKNNPSQPFKLTFQANRFELTKASLSKGERSKPGTPWPLPVNITTTNTAFSLDPNSFVFEAKAANQCDIVSEAIKRYKSLTFITNKKSVADSSLPALKKVSIQIDQPEHCGYPQLNDDESYSIEIVQHDAHVLGSIGSKTVWGALRALETFSQLVYSRNENDTASFYVNQTRIADQPGDH